MRFYEDGVVLSITVVELEVIEIPADEEVFLNWRDECLSFMCFGVGALGGGKLGADQSL